MTSLQLAFNCFVNASKQLEQELKKAKGRFAIVNKSTIDKHTNKVVSNLAKRYPRGLLKAKRAYAEIRRQIYFIIYSNKYHLDVKERIQIAEKIKKSIKAFIKKYEAEVYMKVRQREFAKWLEKNKGEDLMKT